MVKIVVDRLDFYLQRRNVRIRRIFLSRGEIIVVVSIAFWINFHFDIRFFIQHKKRWPCFHSSGLKWVKDSDSLNTLRRNVNESYLRQYLFPQTRAWIGKSTGCIVAADSSWSSVTSIHCQSLKSTRSHQIYNLFREKLQRAIDNSNTESVRSFWTSFWTFFELKIFFVLTKVEIGKSQRFTKWQWRTLIRFTSCSLSISTKMDTTLSKAEDSVCRCCAKNYGDDQMHSLFEYTNDDLELDKMIMLLAPITVCRNDGEDFLV